MRNFAAFIMTYERPEEVRTMITTLLSQTYPPEKILVVDNSTSLATQKILTELNNPLVEYVRTGYNAGPAGAAKKGLETLTAQGFEWIYWGDDDDPPETKNDFKNIFKAVGLFLQTNKTQKIGIVGKRAGKFSRITARTANFRNNELSGIMEADYVSGGHTLIVNSQVVKSGVLPTEKLFFGFEELEFCLKTKKAGFKVLFDADAALSDRLKDGKSDPNYRWRGKAIGHSDKLWRQYYSTRNMLIVLCINKLWFALVFNFFKTIFKSIYGFKFGWSYGIKLFKLQWLALFHFTVKRYGKTDLTPYIQ